MSRIARQLIDQGIFHVLARGNNRSAVFHCPSDYSAYRSLLSKKLSNLPVRLHHYCLMPNHVHLLMSVDSPATALSGLMHRLQLSYTIYHKAQYGSTGHLWEGRFKAIRIDSEKHFFVCASYIELNPVAAGLVERPEEYLFSSYTKYAAGKEIPFLEIHPLYEQLGSSPKDREAAYRGIVQARTATREDDWLKIGFSAGTPGRPKNRDISGNVPISFGR